MDLSPSAWWEALLPSLLAVASVTAAFVFAVAAGIVVVLRLVLRRRRRTVREEAAGGLAGFTWTPPEE
ncbi:hypothetical protein NRK68_28595 [Streptomyces yangpuensis]|uniref:Uncharacterized protein n=1 Tax=Streptomyces yangpuensis TaxID=1648182 RepID=A0ABY5Q4D5_9ACTN|nr:hypothetical protein [Streptomyces yangpuensis]UUY50848.1 hypothetical protein NRK68_28595 [Streptomyces yangpuensis]